MEEQLPSYRDIKCTEAVMSLSCPFFFLDLDECLNGMCKYTGQTCINSLGSFECKCMKGFSQVDYLPGEDMCQGNNRPFPSPPQSLFQNEPKLEILLMVISSNFNANEN